MLQVKAISLLTDTARFCDEDTRLQRIVPYLIVSHFKLKLVMHAIAWIPSKGLAFIFNNPNSTVNNLQLRFLLVLICCAKG